MRFFDKFNSFAIMGHAVFHKPVENCCGKPFFVFLKIFIQNAEFALFAKKGLTKNSEELRGYPAPKRLNSRRQNSPSNTQNTLPLPPWRRYLRKGPRGARKR